MVNGCHREVKLCIIDLKELHPMHAVAFYLALYPDSWWAAHRKPGYEATLYLPGNFLTLRVVV